MECVAGVCSCSVECVWSPLGHEGVAVYRSSQRYVDAAHCVDVAEDEQHGSRQSLQHVHDAFEVLSGHVAHVRRLLAAQDVPQTQLTHVNGPLKEHLAEQEVV